MAEKDVEDQQSTTKENPLFNPLLVGKIFIYLPNKDLLTCRLVIKQWDQEAFRTLKKRYDSSQDSSENTIEFRSSEQVEKFQTMFENNQSKILKHKYRFCNFKIETKIRSKSFFDFIETFENIKGIRIEGGHIVYRRLLDILQICQNLEEFQMKSWFHGVVNFDTATGTTGIGFELPGLKKLDLEMFYQHLPLFPGPLEEFGKFEKKMIESAKNLEAIKILASKLHEIVKDIENFNFAALNEISIYEAGDLTGFITLPVQLKVLEVEIGEEENCSIELMKLLQAQSKSLQVLKINIKECFGNNNIPPINFTTSGSGLQFEKLKELHLNIADQRVLRIGPIYYSRTFPVLEKLHIQFDFLTEESFRGLLRRILQNELFLNTQAPSKSVTKVSITSPFHRNLVRERISPILKEIFVNMKDLDLKVEREQVGEIDIPFRFF